MALNTNEFIDMIHFKIYFQSNISTNSSVTEYICVYLDKREYDPFYEPFMVHMYLATAKPNLAHGHIGVVRYGHNEYREVHRRCRLFWRDLNN